jgi:hypothetical protein
LPVPELLTPEIPTQKAAAEAVSVSTQVIMAAPAGRYGLIAGDGYPSLISTSASNIRFYVRCGLTIRDADRKQYPQQRVFLDGVYDGAGTLLEAMPLHEGDWQIYINAPDLDSVLAVWILLNHAELKRDNGTLLHTHGCPDPWSRGEYLRRLQLAFLHHSSRREAALR